MRHTILNQSDRKQPTIPLSPLTLGSVSSIPAGSYQGKANTATRPCELHEHTHDPSIAQKMYRLCQTPTLRALSGLRSTKKGSVLFTIELKASNLQTQIVVCN